MTYSQNYLEYIIEQLSGLEGVEWKKMFGGIGFFKEGKMFGMIANDVFKLKVNDSNKQDYIDHGMEPHHDPGKKKGMPYWEVPVEVVEDKGILKAWAVKSHLISVNKKG